jgi:hypothetical protein
MEISLELLCEYWSRRCPEPVDSLLETLTDLSRYCAAFVEWIYCLVTNSVLRYANERHRVPPGQFAQEGWLIWEEI